jgi:hypothetical protein
MSEINLFLIFDIGSLEECWMQYFKYVWNEARGDEYDSWGRSTYLFEVDSYLNVCKQIEIYENGTALKYTKEHPSDKYGSLSVSLFDPEGCSSVDYETFCAIWNSTRSMNLSDNPVHDPSHGC